MSAIARTQKMDLATISLVAATGIGIGMSVVNRAAMFAQTAVDIAPWGKLAEGGAFVAVVLILLYKTMHAEPKKDEQHRQHVEKIVADNRDAYKDVCEQHRTDADKVCMHLERLDATFKTASDKQTAMMESHLKLLETKQA